MQGVVASLLFGLVAGTCDGAGYLALHRLLTSHITGNLLLLGADWATNQNQGVLGRLIAIPVFILWAWLVRLAAGKLHRHGLPALRAMLLAMVALLALFLLLGMTIGPFPSQDAPNNLIVGMTGVAAMATLNIVARLWPDLAAGTTAMTGNAVKMAMDLAELVIGEHEKESELLYDSGRLGLTVLAFVGGCALAALVYWKAGTWCTALPLVFAVAMTALWPDEQRLQEKR
ncbi:MAG TPA: YoaK family protein [Stellaceae bacterium]|nr:YoaK family protein [Stellaceae bacterium]